MKRFRAAAALGSIAVAVGISRFLLADPLSANQVFANQVVRLILQLKLPTLSGGFGVYGRLATEDRFFCIQAVAIGLLLLIILRMTNHSISPFTNKGRVES